MFLYIEVQKLTGWKNGDM